MDDEAAVGEAIEMEVFLRNCGDEPEMHAVDCTPPAPTVEVDNRSYSIRYGAATDALPACVTSSYSSPTTLEPGERISWRYKWNGTVASGCFDGNGCDAEIPAPGSHVLRVEFAGHRAEGSVVFG